MAHYGIPNHGVQFIEVVGHREDGMTESLRSITSLGGLRHHEYDLVHSRTSSNKNRWLVFQRASGFHLANRTTYSASDSSPESSGSPPAYCSRVSSS